MRLYLYSHQCCNSIQSFLIAGRSGRGRGRNTLPLEEYPTEEAAAEVKSTAAKELAEHSGRGRGRKPISSEEPPPEALAVERSLEPPPSPAEEGMVSKGSLQAPRSQNAKDFASALR